MPTTYRSYAEQGAHYFDRPHAALPRGPIGGPVAWRGSELSERDWRIALDAAQLAGFERALAAARATGKPLAELTREDFPLTEPLAADVEGWRRELTTGRGFLLLSGLPMERWGEEEASRFFWGFGLALGWPGAQNPQGDLLGHVVDTGDDRANPLVRLYRTRSDIAYHCDAADVVGLLCIGLGVTLLGACIIEFARTGRGTLSPVDPPRRLVARGLYRYVRNPMYLSITTIVLGEVILTGSLPLAVYWTLWFLGANLFVIGFEEPSLRDRFGASYDEYTRQVGRWMPRLRSGGPPA